MPAQEFSPACDYAALTRRPTLTSALPPATVVGRRAGRFAEDAFCSGRIFGFPDYLPRRIESDDARGHDEQPLPPRSILLLSQLAAARRASCAFSSLSAFLEYPRCFAFPPDALSCAPPLSAALLLPAGVLAQRAFVGGLPPELIRSRHLPRLVRHAGRAAREARAEAHLERHRHLHGRRRGRPGEGLLRAPQSRRRADQLRRLDRPAAGSHRHGQGRCRRRHGAALAEAAGRRLRRQDRRPASTAAACACSRRPTAASPRSPTSKGKAIGVTDLAAPDRNFFSIMLHQAGVDPNKEVEWRVFPGDVLPVALKKGEVQAFCQGDPLGWMARERDGLHRGRQQPERRVRPSHLLRARHPRHADPPGEARRRRRWCSRCSRPRSGSPPIPRPRPRVFAPHAKAPVEQLTAMLKSHTHHDTSAGRRPAQPDRGLRRGAEADRGVQAEHRHPEVCRACHRRRAELRRPGE